MNDTKPSVESIERIRLWNRTANIELDDFQELLFAALLDRVRREALDEAAKPGQ